MINYQVIPEYTYFEKYSPSKYTRKCIDGTITGCSNCVGYCMYKGHSGFLTQTQREKHECLRKGCYYFLPKPKRQRYTVESDFERNRILSFVKNYVSALEGLKIISVSGNEVDGWTVNYITISNEYSIYDIEKNISNNLNCEVTFYRLNYSFDRCVQLIMAD